LSAKELAHGVAFHGSELFVASWSGLTRLHYPPGPADRPVTLSADMPQGGDHNLRALAIAADGTLFVSSGSDCNVCNESDPRFATVLRYGAGSAHGQVYARGLRNASGLAFDDRGRLWAVVNGRDNLGDDVPADELDLLSPGADYGWPFCYSSGGKRQADPQYGRPGRCARAVPSAFDFQAHSAPLGMTFYYGSQFPAAYKGAAFVAFHGSWNRSVRTGYKVVSVFFRDGRPQRVQDFATGWLRPDGAVIGRPVGLTVSAEGSLFISDDHGFIYKVTYDGQK
jgi:glucose/arabinose dehydrogenase